MDSTWTAIFAFLGLFTFAIVSPGPNFILVSSTALNRSRYEGVLTAVGVATGSGLFAFAGLVGVLPLIHSVPNFAEIMRFVGGGYLAWIGLGMLRSHRNALEIIKVSNDGCGSFLFLAYRTGLLANLSNPKAWAFYLSLFTLVMGPAFPLWGKVFLNIAMFLVSLSWYLFVALLVSSRKFQPVFLGYQPAIQSVLGVLLIMVGGKIFLGW